jgi:ABC-type phosphate/phosphonate transport system substrate-binding protein
MRTISQYKSDRKNKVIVTSTPINGYPIRIRAQWTPEIIQDISAFHNIDVEAELTAILSEELSSEMNNRIFSRLINGGFH